MSEDAELTRLLAEAEARPLGGWDFGWLGPRMRSTELPWNFAEIVVERARRSSDLLDLGTGGGEWLASLTFRPRRTVATEAWEPNVELASGRLRPLGVTVVRIDPAPDNVDQRDGEPQGRLPFARASFELVTSRHESFVASELARILVPGGRFLTQQAGTGRYDELRRDFGLPPSNRAAWTLSLAVAQLERAGLRVVQSGEAELVTSFADIGALAWFLKAAPWTVPEFSLAEHRGALAELHRRMAVDGPYQVRDVSFWLEAVRDRAREEAV